MLFVRRNVRLEYIKGNCRSRRISCARLRVQESYVSYIIAKTASFQINRYVAKTRPFCIFLGARLCRGKRMSNIRYFKVSRSHTRLKFLKISLSLGQGLLILVLSFAKLQWYRIVHKNYIECVERKKKKY